MALASSRIAPSSSANGLDIATPVRCRPVSAHVHRPLRFPYARLQLKTARCVASASASPPAILERKPSLCGAQLQTLQYSRSRPASTELAPPSPSLQAQNSPGALQSLVQSLEETFRNSPNGELCKRWRDYHGCSNWTGLLSPLDPDLRAEILKYGDLAQLTYDAFDNQDNSQTRGDCLYEEQELLQRAGLTWTGYQVTKYIYATSDVHVVPKWLDTHGMKGRKSNWMGFVAVATDEKEIARLGRRDIVVVWRGTVTRLEWLEDVDGVMVNPVGLVTTAAAADDESHFNSQSCHVGVERGFYTLYTTSNIDNNGGHVSAAEQVRDELKRLVDLYRGDDDKSELSITMTGHSLGGALALLAAYDVASMTTSRLHKDVPVSVMSFAAPRVGNEAFKRRLEEVGVKVLRVVNIHDMVPKVPGIFVHGEASSTSKVASGSTQSDHHVNSHDHTQSAYVHVGVELRLDNHYSPFLKKNVNLADSHNLELYLHLLDGYRSAKVPFIGLRVEDDHMSFHHGFTITGFKLQPALAGNDAHQLDTIRLYMRFMKRDLALVNKTTGLLLDELHVLARWQEKKLPRPSPRLSPSTITCTRTTRPGHHVLPEFLQHFTRATNGLIPTA